MLYLKIQSTTFRQRGIIYCVVEGVEDGTRCMAAPDEMLERHSVSDDACIDVNNQKKKENNYNIATHRSAK